MCLELILWKRLLSWVNVSWDRYPIGLDILRKLIEKSEKVLPEAGQWKVFHLGFARVSWTIEAEQFAQGLNRAKITGQNWQAEEVMLRTLDQVDAELASWTA